MKLLISFTFIIIICALMNSLTSVPVTEANDGLTAIVERNLADYTWCRIWVTDSNLNYIAGNTKDHYCRGDDFNFTLPAGTTTYFVFAHVVGSWEEDKKRGPYNGNACLNIHGSVDIWKFSDLELKYCFYKII
ncbi:1866_t:CDS:2 [Funneliformis geosporum]|uniref:13509_t:CDS:1 n=1 Tax=Funneliformis geosporum TaxID=1117311 RepID=A0A9W4WNR5_9GLOM|nr:13509_t:CDS:2 [Funneliformis geosporum]CAI2167794.1 1866_t:CDS:2 [Funneliformis geosporum]